MNKDSKIHINYPKLIEDAMLSVVKSVLKSTSEDGLKGDHYFLISFKTNHQGVELSKTLRNRYPKEMTIVLQHQFNNLSTNNDQLSVDLSFDGIMENVVIPFDSMTAFVDPTTKFAVQLNSIDVKKPKLKESSNKEDIALKSKVISLDQYRKK
jgi:hypothetical protein